MFFVIEKKQTKLKWKFIKMQRLFGYRIKKQIF